MPPEFRFRFHKLFRTYDSHFLSFLFLSVRYFRIWKWVSFIYLSYFGARLHLRPDTQLGKLTLRVYDPTRLPQRCFRRLHGPCGNPPSIAPKLITNNPTYHARIPTHGTNYDIYPWCFIHVSYHKAQESRGSKGDTNSWTSNDSPSALGAFPGGNYYR